MFRVVSALVAALFLAACGADKTWDSDARVDAARFVAGPPPAITLFTVINDRNGTGAHSGLMINGSQRVLFDPAGTWQHPMVPVRNDVHFGITDRMVNFYLDYHARDSKTETSHVIEHTVLVSPEVAELVMRRAMDYGAVPKAQCANSISTILRGVPGFEGLPATWFPKKLGQAFGKLPGVTERIVTEENDNPGEGHGVLLVDKNGQPV